MKIIAHRGMWKDIQEKNSEKAFERAFNVNFGVETDIRDYKGELVVSHDIGSKESIALKDFLNLYKRIGNENLLALNIKADGISRLLLNALDDYGVQNYFTFDMSVPEMVIYRNIECKYFSRQSDIEKECVLYDKCEGVWMDSFFSQDHINHKKIMYHLQAGKIVVIVSPELHGEDPVHIWEILKENDLFREQRLCLCTDMPMEAKSFYGEE